MLTFEHKKKATLHFIEELQNKNAISVNSFPLLKNDEEICEKIYLLHHIELTIAHKNLIFFETRILPSFFYAAHSSIAKHCTKQAFAYHNKNNNFARLTVTSQWHWKRVRCIF